MTYEEYLKQQALNESKSARTVNESITHLRRLGEEKDRIHLRRLGEEKSGRVHLRRLGEEKDRIHLRRLGEKVHLRRLGEKVHLRRLGEEKSGRLNRVHLRRIGEGAVQDRHDRFDANKKNWTEYVDTIYKAFKEGKLDLTREQASTFYMLKNYFLKHGNERLFNRNGVETINPIRKIYRAVTKGDYETAEDLIADFKSPLRAE